MLSSNNDWVEKDYIKCKTIEYSEIDFYGPFLILYMQKQKDGKLIVTPINSRIETAELSKSDFDLILKAAQELCEVEGKFVLRTKLFDVDIDSAETVEENLLKKLKELPLF